MEDSLLIKNIRKNIASKKSQEVINDCNTFLAKNPRNEEVLLYLALSYYFLGEFKKSEETLIQILSINQNNWRAYHGLALSQYKLKKFIKSDQNFQKALDIEKKDYGLLLDYGLFLSNQQMNKKAQNIFEKLILLDPNNFVGFYNLANCCVELGEYKKALDLYTRSLKLDKQDNAQILCSIGVCFERLNDFKNATIYFKKSLDIEPNLILALINLAIIEQSQGNFSSSEQLLNKIISIDPSHGEAYRILSLQKTFTSKDSEIVNMKQVYNQLAESENKMFLGYALSKANEDIKNFKEACFYLKKSNQFRRLMFPNYNINNEIKNFNSLKKIFTKSFYDKFKNLGISSKKLIFIIGMPRSGTTLVEQIISSHSKVTAGGELNFFSEAFNDSITYKSTAEMFKKIENINDYQINKIGKVYLKKIDQLSLKTNFVTDKNPINFQLLPLIAICLPDAKIIHCSRDPNDTCLSIYKNYFWQKVMPWSYDERELAQFYQLYKDLMQYYENIINKKKIFQLSYENLITDSNETIKSLINYCELPWEEQCLEFYNNKNTVKTASVSQVRKKIYKSSSKKWENFKTYLPDLFDNLS